MCSKHPSAKTYCPGTRILRFSSNHISSIRDDLIDFIFLYVFDNDSYLRNYDLILYNSKRKYISHQLNEVH